MNPIVTTGVLGTCLALVTACGGGLTDRLSGGASGESSESSSVATAAPSAKASRSASVPAGFKRVGSQANGVSIAVPKSWLAMDLTQADIENALRARGMTGVELARVKMSLNALVSAKAVWATDPESVKASPNRFATNLNGFCQPSAGLSADQVITEAKRQLGQLNATISKANEVSLGDGKAIRIVYTFPTQGVQIRGTQYWVPGGDKTCIVTLSTDLSGKQALFDRIGATIRPL